MPTRTLPPTPQTKLLQDLQATQNLLHLVNHRNHNQHRRSKWWKEFGMLRRGVRGLIILLEGEGDEREKEREKRMGFLAGEIVPRCWVAFSAVVADNQYAPLGLMLIGTLARLAKVIGMERIGGVEEMEIIRDDNDMLDVNDDVVGSEGHLSRARTGLEDIGVVVERKDVELEGQVEDRSILREMEVESGLAEEHERQGEVEKRVETGTPISAPKRKKKKKKKGDAIDELFKGLI